MRIEAVTLALPKRLVTNADLLNEVRSASEATFNGDLDAALRLIERTLRATGTDTRYWVDDAQETSLSVTLAACRAALDAAGPHSTIDLVISASVFGELIEPATSNLLAHRLGLDHVECVDVKEACDGWVKAMKIADALLKTEHYRRILIVNGEFSLTPDFAIRPALFQLTSSAELEWRFPIYTIGEAATATIVSRDDVNAWSFTNKTHNDLYDLCTVTPHWHRRGELSERVAKDGPGLFTSWAADLTGNGIPLAVQTFRDAGLRGVDSDVLFTHASSKKDWTRIASEIGLADKIFDIHARTGNLVSASIPAAMALAERDGVLKRGQRIAVLCASAGMTFSTASFVY